MPAIHIVIWFDCVDWKDEVNERHPYHLTLIPVLFSYVWPTLSLIHLILSFSSRLRCFDHIIEQHLEIMWLMVVLGGLISYCLNLSCFTTAHSYVYVLYISFICPLWRLRNRLFFLGLLPFREEHFTSGFRGEACGCQVLFRRLAYSCCKVGLWEVCLHKDFEDKCTHRRWCIYDLGRDSVLCAFIILSFTWKPLLSICMPVRSIHDSLCAV